MAPRISPIWWPVLAAGAPTLAALGAVRYVRFRGDRDRATRVNAERIEAAKAMSLPAVSHLELTALVEEKAEDGFLGDAGISYRIETDRGAVLLDVGFGPTRPALAHNARRLGFTLDDVDALVVSHLHPDHAGGLRASRTRSVAIPPELGDPRGKPCYLPDAATADCFDARVVDGPRAIGAGIATTGPLARSLYFLGWTEEQALFARVRGKGLVVITGCGHPTVETILRMARALSREPPYALIGGLHFPVTGGRGNRLGIQFQTLIGTGKPPWSRIDDDDLTEAIRRINESGVREVHLSAHDTCDHALDRFHRELVAEVHVLRAGATIRIGDGRAARGAPPL